MKDDCANITCRHRDTLATYYCTKYKLAALVYQCDDYVPNHTMSRSDTTQNEAKIDQEREAEANEEKAKLDPFWTKEQPLSREEWDKEVDKLEVETPRQPMLGDCLDEAKACITGERQDQYGNPEDSFALIADYWRTYLGHPVTALDVAHMMILFKVARCSGQAPKRDNYTDICGYSSIAADRIMEAK